MGDGLTGTYVFGRTEAARLRVGPLELWIGRRPHEWRLAVSHDPDPLLDRLAVDHPVPAYEPPAGSARQRFATDEGDDVLELALVLPDREVVVRPDPPVTVLPGEEVHLYVGCPLWLRLLTADGRVLAEVPTVRMPLTWFGASPAVGELCHALRSKARLLAAEMPRRAHRAIARICVANEADERLVLERLKVPVPHLGLYRGADGTCWTQEIRVVSTRAERARIELGAGAPAEAGEVTLLASPRLSGSPNVVVRALDALLS